MLNNAAARYPVNTPSLAFGCGWVKPAETLNIRAELHLLAVDNLTAIVAGRQDNLDKDAGAVMTNVSFTDIVVRFYSCQNGPFFAGFSIFPVFSLYTPA